MGIHKLMFMYIFVDHTPGEQKCIHIEVEVCGLKKGKQHDWIYSENIEEAIEWCRKSKTFKLKLKHQVKNIINDKHPGLFDNFSFVKADESKHSEKVNMNSGLATKEIRLRKVVCVEKCIAKFSRGQPTGLWTEMYDYPKESYTYIYKLEDDGTNINLVHVASFEDGEPSFLSKVQQKT